MTVLVPNPPGTTQMKLCFFMGFTVIRTSCINGTIDPLTRTKNEMGISTWAGEGAKVVKLIFYVYLTRYSKISGSSPA